jgi:hypothetical protein
MAQREDWRTYEQCRIRASLKPELRAHATRIVMQFGLGSDLFTNAHFVVNIAAHIHLQRCARATLAGFGLLECVGPAVMVGTQNTSMRLVPVHRVDIQASFHPAAVPLPLSTSISGGTPYTTPNESFFRHLCSLLRHTHARPSLSELDCTFNQVIRPSLVQGSPLAVTMQELPEDYDLGHLRIAHIEALQYRPRGAVREEWDGLLGELARLCASNLKSHQTHNFGKAVARCIRALGTALTCPDDDRDALLDKIEAFFQPSYLLHAIYEEDSPWTWTDGHVVFRDSAIATTPAWTQRSDRSHVVRLFRPLYELLLYMLREGSVGTSAAVIYPPPDDVWTASESWSAMRPTHWRFFMKGRGRLSAAAIVVMEYCATVVYELSLEPVENEVNADMDVDDGADEVQRFQPPAGFRGIPITPIKTRFVREFVSWTYTAFVGGILRGLPYPMHGVAGLPREALCVPIFEVRWCRWVSA